MRNWMSSYRLYMKFLILSLISGKDPHPPPSLMTGPGSKASGSEMSSPFLSLMPPSLSSSDPSAAVRPSTTPAPAAPLLGESPSLGNDPVLYFH